MAFWEDIKSDTLKKMEGMLGDTVQYQIDRALNTPTLVRLRSDAPSGNLTEKDLLQGKRGDAGGIPTGNSNGDLSNSVTSPWLSNKWLMIGGGVLILLIVVLLVKKGK